MSMRKPGHRPALTLVEVTAVTVALAGLIGTVLPAVRSARDKSLEAGCRERLGKIAQAGLVYAVEDANELAIPIGPGDARSAEPYTAYYGFGGKSGLGPLRNANVSPFGGINAYLMGSPHRPLNAVLLKKPIPLPALTGGGGRGGTTRDWTEDARRDLDVYHCPADDGFPGMHYRGWKSSRLSGYDYFGTSYAAAALFVAKTIRPILESNSIYGRPVSRVPAPSETIAYQETAARFAIFANNTADYDQGGCYWPYGIGQQTAEGWHGTPFSFTVGFLDGHAAIAKIKGHGLFPEPPFMAPSCSGGSCACIFVRGTGWRLDTLPADLVTTTKVSVGFGLRTSDGSSVDFDPVGR